VTAADAAQVAATTLPEDPEPAPRRERIVSWLVIALVLLPFVVSALALLGSDGTRYHPYNDQAIIELQVRNVVDHVPLLGPYSRFDWFHPGPALYYVLAVPYWLTGATSGSLAFAALVVNAIAVLGVLLVARRRGGLAMLLVTSVVTGLLVHGLGAPFLRDVWNPYVTVLLIIPVSNISRWCLKEQITVQTLS
jgi:hypothetical protein